jgi:hypothetical protein
LLIADTGAIGHYLHVSGQVVNHRPATHPLTVLIADGTAITSTHIGELHLPNLPLAARLCHLFPDLHIYAFLSIGQLCYNGCTALFTNTHLLVHHNDNLLLTRH